jgi:AGZA family xanthine/uracil permease-like MFS transporter
VGYSWLNGLFVTVVCLTGTLGWISWAVPIEAGMAIVIWIGIVITAQAFQATPHRHAPAVVIGLLPGVAAWGALLVKSAGRAAGVTSGPAWGEKLALADLPPDGLFSLEQGFIFTAMLLAGATVSIIEGQFRRAAVWFLVAAGLSYLGVMHGWRWSPDGAPIDTALDIGLGAAPRLALGYLLAAGVCALAPLVGARQEGAGHG